MDQMDGISESLRRAIESLPSPGSADASTESDETPEQVAHRLQREEHRRLREAGLPLRFLNATLHGQQPHPKTANALLSADGRDSFYLHGPCGTGKTFLAAGYLRHWRQNNRGRIAFVTAPRLFAELRSTYDGQESELQVIERYSCARLLVLDDLGSESFKSADWLADRLYLILGERHDECRPTVITSNYDLAEMAERVGDRIVWRISESCGPHGVIEVGGRNLRARGAR